jgi:hypothetical protein
MDSWDGFFRRLRRTTKSRRRPRLAHRESIALCMTMALYELLNRLPGFLSALETLFEEFSEKALIAFVKKWHLPPRYGAKDLEWSRRLWAAGAPRRLYAGMRSYPGLERGEIRKPTVWQAKGYELTPPPLANPRLLRTSAEYLLVRLLVRFSYQKIATKAGKSVSTVFGAMHTWATRLGYPPAAV